MSITYEEALATLESMFGSPWNRFHLDSILRHFQGHMENTVEAILAHGDKDPSLLLTNLKEGKSHEAQDSMLAQQLAEQERQQHSLLLRSTDNPTGPSLSLPSSSSTSSTFLPKTGRGVPTELPKDFLRIPGYTTSSNNSGSTANNQMDQDEALARMLQDELFSQELANNPEFAHLAGLGGRGRRGAPTPVVPRASTMTRPANQTVSQQLPPIMDHITELGQDAKKRLQLLAAQWNMGVNRLSSRFAGNATPSKVSENTAAFNETRGLLDDKDGDDEMELTFSESTSSSKNKYQ